MQSRAILAMPILIAGMVLGGCGGASSNQTSQTPTVSTASINFVATDTPPADVTVLAFQIQLRERATGN